MGSRTIRDIIYVDPMKTRLVETNTTERYSCDNKDVCQSYKHERAKIVDFVPMVRQDGGTRTAIERETNITYTTVNDLGFFEKLFSPRVRQDYKQTTCDIITLPNGKEQPANCKTAIFKN